MKLIILAPLALLAAPALSQPANDNLMVITAASRPTITQWSQKIERDLSRHLVSPRSFTPWNIAEGTVLVRFVCGVDGKPASVALYRGSGSRQVDQAALRAVSHMATMHPMPARVSHDATFQANIIFAVDQASLERQQTTLRRDEALRMARESDRGRAIVVLDSSRWPAS